MTLRLFLCYSYRSEERRFPTEQRRQSCKRIDSRILINKLPVVKMLSPRVAQRSAVVFRKRITLPDRKGKTKKVIIGWGGINFYERKKKTHHSSVIWSSQRSREIHYGRIHKLFRLGAILQKNVPERDISFKNACKGWQVSNFEYFVKASFEYLDWHCSVYV